MKKNVSSVLAAIIFFCGLALFLYPTASNLYNEYLNQKMIGDYEEVLKENVPVEQYSQAMADARAYNQYRGNPEKLEELGLTYENVLNVAGNGIMGYIEIPKISVSLVIYHTLEEDGLQKGIGHMQGTDLPVGGESTHCVLAGHTGLPSAKLLTNIDRLEVGDTFFLHVLDEVLEYRVDDVSVVLPSEASRIKVISGHDLVTLVTCTPYGINSHRLLVRGTRVDGASNLESHQLAVPNELAMVEMKYLITFSLIGLFFMFVSFRKIYSLRRGRKKKGE